jgi:site-specific DNA-methyltransferase (adenine-specific)
LLNSVINGDCLEVMKKIKDKSIDLVLTDPPYNISKKSNFHTMKDRKNQRTGTDFGEWDKGFINDDWIKEAARILKPGGALIGFNSFSMGGEIERICKENNLIYKDSLIWHKTNPMPRNRDRRYIPNIELVQWFVKPGGKWVFNRKNEKYESCILSFPSESGGGFKRYHPTQKPVKLIQHLIAIHSKENDVILDCFAGSGTTAIAAMNTNRQYICIEMDKHYHSMSVERVKEHKQQLSLEV